MAYNKECSSMPYLNLTAKDSRAKGALHMLTTKITNLRCHRISDDTGKLPIV